MDERVMKHAVHRCPICQQAHDYFLVVARGKEPAPLLFGGSGPGGIAVSCPVTGEAFAISPRLDEGEEVVKIQPANDQGPRTEDGGRRTEDGGRRTEDPS